MMTGFHECALQLHNLLFKPMTNNIFQLSQAPVYQITIMPSQKNNENDTASEFRKNAYYIQTNNIFHSQW